MTARAPGAPPARLARITGGLLLVIAVCALFAELGVRSSLVVPGDAATTADRIQASPELFRLGLVGYLVAFLVDVPVAVLFYVILRPVSPISALMAMAFRLVYTAVVGAVLLQYYGAMLALSGADYLSGVETNQLHTLALFNLDMFEHGFSLALVFFGLHLVFLGSLLSRSRQLPTALGILVALGGLAYVIDGLSLILAPGLHARVAPVLGTLGLSELALALWLLLKGLRQRAPTARGDGDGASHRRLRSRDGTSALRWGSGRT